ncbi:MAG: hypothetical protein N3D73_01185 [Candidatus Diapherotrites archaeon]|nr:hypothetical protein [Candidatus Diapherotrites archaeon]
MAAKKINKKMNKLIKVTARELARMPHVGARSTYYQAKAIAESGKPLGDREKRALRQKKGFIDITEI